MFEIDDLVNHILMSNVSEKCKEDSLIMTTYDWAMKYAEYAKFPLESLGALVRLTKMARPYSSEELARALLQSEVLESVAGGDRLQSILEDYVKNTEDVRRLGYVCGAPLDEILSWAEPDAPAISREKFNRLVDTDNYFVFARAVGRASRRVSWMNRVTFSGRVKLTDSPDYFSMLCAGKSIRRRKDTPVIAGWTFYVDIDDTPSVVTVMGDAPGGITLLDVKTEVSE
jgi:hypothetical protein